MNTAKPIILFLMLIAMTGCSNVLTLSAPPGNYQIKPLAEPAANLKISVTAKLTQFSPAKKWPPAAYLGFYQGKDRSNSIQVMIMRKQPQATHLVVGYRAIQNDKQVLGRAIVQVPVDSTVHVILSIAQGLVTIKINDHTPVQIKTTLTKVTPYVSVSSGTADFSLTH